MAKQQIKPQFSKSELMAYIAKTIDEKTTFGKTVTVNIEPFMDQLIANTPIPVVGIRSDAFLKIMMIVLQQSAEVAWHGIVERVGEIYMITDVMIYPQKVSAVTAEADEAAYGPWMAAYRERINNIRMQGHSHVNMGVTASGTDTTYYEELSRQVQDYYIFMIVNKSMNLNLRFYDVTNNVLHTDMDMIVYDKDDKPFGLLSWYKEQAALVTTKLYSASPLVNNALPFVHSPLTRGEPEIEKGPKKSSQEIAEEEWQDGQAAYYDRIYGRRKTR